MTTQEIYSIYQEHPHITTDTRSIRKGSIFFALKGDRFNGNQFASEALEKGASFAVIDEPLYEGPDAILVEDVLSALQDLARFHRRQFKIPVVGLTGSNGKTTSKELVASVLKQQFRVYATQGNLNNHIGVPLSLLEVHGEHEVAVIEMGANHQKEIEFLCSICEPDFGFITNFGKAHLDGFGGVEGVKKGKSELYDFLRNNSKTAFVCGDDPEQMHRSEGIKRITFGKQKGDLLITPLENTRYAGVRWNSQKALSQLIGSYNYGNLAYAVLIGREFGLKDEQIARGIEGYAPHLNRSQFQKGKVNDLIVDCYNANPSSMEVAIENLVQFDRGAVILGDMLELGDESGAEHQKIVELLIKRGFDKVVLVGPLFAATDRPKSFASFTDTNEVRTFLKSEPLENYTVLLKGSRGIKLEELIPYL